MVMVMVSCDGELSEVKELFARGCYGEFPKIKELTARGCYGEFSEIKDDEASEDMNEERHCHH